TALLKLFAMSAYIATVTGGAHYYFGALLTPGQLATLVAASTFMGFGAIIFVSNQALATPIKLCCPPGLFSISKPFKNPGPFN
ncbi:MAG TPA: hypothetical protein VFO37_08615, partial [Chitinophagaceae bacterium]|nr:hypothetical protein [Chitinophagaceae bacterium]